MIRMAYKIKISGKKVKEFYKNLDPDKKRIFRVGYYEGKLHPLSEDIRKQLLKKS